MFAKYCRDKPADSGPMPNDALPNQFDAGRRTSVSAECWNTAFHAQNCGATARQPSFSMPVPQRATSVPAVSPVDLGNNISSSGNVPQLSRLQHSTLNSNSAYGKVIGNRSGNSSANRSRSGSVRDSDTDSRRSSGARSPQHGASASQLAATAGSNVPKIPESMPRASHKVREKHENDSEMPIEGEDIPVLEMYSHGTAYPGKLMHASYHFSGAQSEDGGNPGLKMRERAEQTLRRMIFFEDLTESLMSQVLDSMQERSVGANENIVSQGDEGNELFVLDQGEVEYLVDGKLFGRATPGAAFGELALLYNSPRAATVRSVTPCHLLTLDRLTMKRITVAKHTYKRLHSQEVFTHIEVFADLPSALQLRIADALHPVSYAEGDVIIRQGDVGTEFFLIDEGTVDIITNGEAVGRLGPGSYFGELALIYDTPRAATVRAASKKLKLEVLSSDGFAQLIGADLVAELRKRDPRNKDGAKTTGDASTGSGIAPADASGNISFVSKVEATSTTPEVGAPVESGISLTQAVPITKGARPIATSLPASPQQSQSPDQLPLPPQKHQKK